MTSIRWFLFGIFILALIIAGVLIMPHDVMAVKKITGCDWLHSDVRRTIMLCEAYGFFPTVIILLIGLAMIIPDVRKHFTRSVLAVIGAGIFADLLKFFIARARPYSFLPKLEQSELTENVAENAAEISTWLGFCRFDLGMFNAAHQSFPSGHTTVAAALTAMLWSIFPQTSARIFWSFMLIMLMSQRLMAKSHYPSDVLFGAALGILFAQLFCVENAPLWNSACKLTQYIFSGKLFSRRELQNTAPESEVD